MKEEIFDAIIEKSKTKKNGIYSYKGIKIKVKDGRAKILADQYGNVFQVLGQGAISKIGKVKPYERMKTLKDMEI